MKFNLGHLGPSFSYSFRMIYEPRNVLSLERSFSILTLLTFWSRYFFVGRDCPVHGMVFNSILNLHPPQVPDLGACLRKVKLFPNPPLPASTGTSEIPLGIDKYPTEG